MAGVRRGQMKRAGIPSGPPTLSQCCSRTHNGPWNFVEPTPEGRVALLRAHTWGCWTLGGPRSGMKAAGALGAKVSSLAEHVRVSRTP